MADDRNPAPGDRNSPASTHSDGNEQWVILNPTSGTADHIVMGHHGAGRIGRAVLGSAARTVVQAAEHPATIVP